MEEFQEADVLWPDIVADAHHHDCHRHRHRHRPAAEADDSHGRRRQQHLITGQQQPRAAVVHPLQSPPVRIPSMPPAGAARPASRDSWTRCCDGDDDDGAEEAGMIVPPHVLAARRCAGERRVASSVCVGHGRTLKGRDLRAVRNAVLHMTGFLSSSDNYCDGYTSRLAARD